MTIRSIKFPLLLCLALLCLIPHTQAQISIVDSGQHCSIRGMSIPDDRVIWLSGSNGHIARSTDAGKTWSWMVVAGYEKTDFRDIHAFDSTTAVIMGIDNPAYVLKTKDGGRSWNLVYSKSRTGMFLDAMDFRGQDGICIGDPIEEGGRRMFFVMRSTDGGDTWHEEPADRLPLAAQGEAVFSASGTNIALLDSKDFDYSFISGGFVSNLYLVGRNGKTNKVSPLPIAKGKETNGAFSMATDGRKAFFCVGGDYKEPYAAAGNLAWSMDNGFNWKTPGGTPPNGYRSCVRIIGNERLVACGSNGVDMCSKPNDWRHISAEGFNVCVVSPHKKMIIFGGDKGRIGLLRL